MTDLFDRARPVRDAVMAEIDRITKGEDISDWSRGANELGVHLSAVMLAFSSLRHDTTTGLIADQHFNDLLAGAFGNLISNAAMAFRPMQNGNPIPASINACLMLQNIAEQTMKQVHAHESGAQDFVIPFQKGDDGSLEPKPFDFNDMMPRGKP